MTDDLNKPLEEYIDITAETNNWGINKKELIQRSKKRLFHAILKSVVDPQRKKVLEEYCKNHLNESEG